METNTDYIFEPNKSEIINELLPKSLKMQLLKTLEILLPVNMEHV